MGRSARVLGTSVVAIVSVAALGGCNAPAPPCASSLGCGASMVNEWLPTTQSRDVDILFLIDNSPGCAPQHVLIRSIPRFVQKIEDAKADYHIGIATSDVGTYVAPGQPWSISLGSCNSFEGDDGTLQRVACSTRSGVSADAIAACAAACPDPKFVPQDGQGYISSVKGVTNVPKAISMGVDIGPRNALQCMVGVGDAGCGIQGQLEGAKRALDGHNPMNAGFLRPGSVVAVIFLTDEDDCSVRPLRRSENDPATMDCPTPDRDAAASCFNPDYRCLARDVVCDQPLNTTGDKTNCHERDDSYLEPVDTYVRFFKSLRPENRLLIAGLWTLPGLEGPGKLIVTQRAGSTRSEGLNRAEGVDAGCVNPSDATIFGRPQLRLSKLARQIKGSIELNVCDANSYPSGLDAIAAGIKSRLAASCLSAVPRIEGGKPACIVGDVDAATPLASPATPFPLCGGGCCSAWAGAAEPSRADAGIQAACAGETADACYCALPSTAGACGDGAVLGVWRKAGADGPPSKVTNVQCATAG